MQLTFYGLTPLVEAGFPGNLDAALLVLLPPGSYTAQVSGAANTSGIALCEVYEVP